jgi:hypothetical protein
MGRLDPKRKAEGKINAWILVVRISSKRIKKRGIHFDLSRIHDGHKALKAQGAGGIHL